MLTTKMSSAIWTHLSTYTHKSATLASKFPQRTALEWLKSKKHWKARLLYFPDIRESANQLLSIPYCRAYGYIIDTPGIKGFGTFDMEEEEIGHYFPEIFKTSADCKYGNCTHRHEPGCAVRKAVEEHLISESRYTSYLNMLEDKEEGKYRAAY